MSMFQLPSGERPAAMQSQDEGDFDRLPEHLVFKILKRVADDSDREALVCLLVCKQWNHDVRQLVRTLEFGKYPCPDYANDYSPDYNPGYDPKRENSATSYNLVFPFVMSLEFPNLQSLHLHNADANMGNWCLVFEALGRNCPDIECLRIDEATPRISLDDLLILHMSLPRLRTLGLAIESVTSDAMEYLDLLTNIRDLTISGPRPKPDKYQRMPRNLAHIESLTLDVTLQDFNKMMPQNMTSLRRLRLMDGITGLVQAESLLQLTSLSVGHEDDQRRMIKTHRTLSLGGLPALREFTHGWRTRPEVGGPTGLDGCRLLTKLHLHAITKQHLRAIVEMKSLEELRGYLGASIGDGDLDGLVHLPLLRRLHLELPIHILLDCYSEPHTCVSPRQLESISAMKQLRELSLHTNDEVRDYTCLDRLPNLLKLQLGTERYGWAADDEVKGEGEEGPAPPLPFPSAPELHIMNRSPPKELPLFTRPEAIRALKISLWGGLLHLAQVSLLPNLQNLSICHCHSLATISLPESLGRLTGLEVVGCHTLLSVVSLAPALVSATLKTHPLLLFISLPTIRHLTVEACPSLPFLGPLNPALENLVIHENGNLWRIQLPESVRTLWVTQCTLLQLTPLTKPTLLTTLIIEGCYTMTMLPSLHYLPLLQSITISGCPALSTLPRLDCLESLLRLTIHNCPRLAPLPTLPRSMISLYLSWCSRLTYLPTVAHPKSAMLKTVHVEKCYLLKNVRSLLGIDSLERFTVKYCPRLQCKGSAWASRFRRKETSFPLPATVEAVYYRIQGKLSSSAH